MPKVVAVRKDTNGVITDYKLDNGQVVNADTAVQMVEAKQIEGCNVATSKTGTKSIRSYPDGNTNNNLDNLQSF